MRGNYATMSLLIPALLGFVIIEFIHVQRGLRKNATPFDIGYYLIHNWAELVLNAMGTTLLLFTAPAVMHYLRYSAARWLTGVPDAALADNVLAPVTGAAIGLLGAMFVRWVVRKGEEVFGSVGKE